MALGLLIKTINEHEAEIADLKRQLAESRERERVLHKALEDLWGFTESLRYTEMGMRWIEEPIQITKARAALQQPESEAG